MTISPLLAGTAAYGSFAQITHCPLTGIPRIPVFWVGIGIAVLILMFVKCIQKNAKARSVLARIAWLLISNICVAAVIILIVIFSGGH